MNNLEYTLAIIKPDAIQAADEIKSILSKYNFHILDSQYGKINEGRAAQFCQHKSETKDYFDNVEHLSSGLSEVLLLAKDDAVQDLLNLLGPEQASVARKTAPNSLRAKYSRGPSDYHNAMHGSETLVRARDEIKFFFPNFLVEPLRKASLDDFPGLMKLVMDGAYKLSVERPDKPFLWLSEFFSENAPVQIIPPDGQPPINYTSVETEENLETAEPEHYADIPSKDAVSSETTFSTATAEPEHYADIPSKDAVSSETTFSTATAEPEHYADIPSKDAVSSETTSSIATIVTEKTDSTNYDFEMFSEKCKECQNKTHNYNTIANSEDLVVCPVCKKIMQFSIKPTYLGDKDFCKCSLEEIRGSHNSFNTKH